MAQADERLGIRHPLAINAAEGAVDQTAAHLALALVEAPLGQMLEHEHAQDDRGRRAESPPPRALGMAPDQRVRDQLDQGLVFEERVDPAQRGIPELIGIGEEDFDETALLVRSPHHGVSGRVAA
jgi:hypothetical protein